MIWLIMPIFIGAVAGWLMSMLTEIGGLGLLWSVILGAVAGFITSFFFLLVGARLVGQGYDILVSQFAAAVGAIVLLLLVHLIKK